MSKGFGDLLLRGGISIRQIQKMLQIVPVLANGEGSLTLPNVSTYRFGATELVAVEFTVQTTSGRRVPALEKSLIGGCKTNMLLSWPVEKEFGGDQLLQWPVSSKIGHSEEA